MKSETDRIVRIKRNVIRINWLAFLSLITSTGFILPIVVIEQYEFMEKIVLIIAGAIWLIIAIFIYYYSTKLTKELPI